MFPKNKTSFILVISVVLNFVLLTLLAFALISNLGIFNTNSNTPGVVEELHFETLSFKAPDSSYKVKIYTDWETLILDDQNVIFKPESTERDIFTVFSEKSDLEPRVWYTNRFHSQSGTEEELTINGYKTFKNIYSENGFDYIDYVVDVDNYNVLFHFTHKDGENDNSEYLSFFENIVQSVSGF